MEKERYKMTHSDLNTFRNNYINTLTEFKKQLLNNKKNEVSVIESTVLLFLSYIAYSIGSLAMSYIGSWIYIVILGLISVSVTYFFMAIGKMIFYNRGCMSRAKEILEEFGGINPLYSHYYSKDNLDEENFNSKGVHNDVQKLLKPLEFALANIDEESVFYFETIDEEKVVSKEDKYTILENITVEKRGQAFVFSYLTNKQGDILKYKLLEYGTK